MNKRVAKKVVRKIHQCLWPYKAGYRVAWPRYKLCTVGRAEAIQFGGDPRGVHRYLPPELEGK